MLERERFATEWFDRRGVALRAHPYSNDIPAAVFAMPAKMDVVQGDARTKPSSDVNALARTAGFAARTPPYLPEGFVTVAGYVVEINGVRTLHLLYSDGIRTVSLFEDKGQNAVDLQRYHPAAAAVGSDAAQSAEQGSTRLLVWTASGVHYSARRRPRPAGARKDRRLPRRVAKRGWLGGVKTIVLDGFHPLVRDWFAGSGSGTPPSPTSSRAGRSIRAGGDVLISAPTGSGKTLAAFLMCLDGLVRRAAGGDVPGQRPSSCTSRRSRP